jgi:cobalt-zinc-cadmium efflux system outer membrane protein
VKPLFQSTAISCVLWIADSLVYAQGISSTSKPATPSPITLQQVLDTVDRHYPLIKAAMQDLEKAKGDVLSASGGFDPVLKSGFQTTPSGQYENRSFDAVIEQATPLWGSRFYAGYRQGFGKFGPYDEKLKTNSGGEVRGGVEIPLLRGGAIDDRRARIAANHRFVDASTEALTLQKFDSRRQASLRYFDWVAAGEKLKVARALLSLARDRDQAMHLRVRKGDAASIDQIDNERSVMQREATLVAATRSLEKAALELSLFLRDAEGRPIVSTSEQLPSEGLPHPEEKSQDVHVRMDKLAEAETFSNHPEMRRMQALIDQNAVERDLAQNMLLPKIDADLAVSRDSGSGVPDKNTLEYKAGIKIELPLRLRTARGRLDGALASRSKLEVQKDLARDRIRAALKDYTQAIQAARARIALTQKELHFSIKVEEAERIRFRHGDSNLLMVNLREQATADARQRAIDALADYHRATAEMEAASAGMMSGGQQKDTVQPPRDM